MSFAKRGANTQNEKNLADRIKLLNEPEIEKLIMDNYAENISGSIILIKILWMFFIMTGYFRL